MLFFILTFVIGVTAVLLVQKGESRAQNSRQAPVAWLPVAVRKTDRNRQVSVVPMAAE